MQEKASPYILFISWDFMRAAKKSMGWNFCLMEMLKKLDVDARKLTREEAQSRLDEIGKIKGAIISKADVVKDIAKAFFVGASLFAKKISYTCGFDLGDGLIIEFFVFISRPLSRTNLVCLLWINIPYNESGAAKLKGIYKKLGEKIDKSPLTEKDWEGLEPIRSRLAQVGIEGADLDLWPTIVAEE